MSSALRNVTFATDFTTRRTNEKLTEQSLFLFAQYCRATGSKEYDTNSRKFFSCLAQTFQSYQFLLFRI